MSPITDLYKRLLGEGPAASRPRSLDEQVEAARPAEAGRSAQVLEQAAHVAPDRTSELVALTAAVVGVGYGDQVDRASADGNFDVTVFQNLTRAANVIAPGRPLASLDPVRLRAIITAGLQSSNGAFLMNMKDSAGASNSLVSASKLTPDGGKVASEFLVGGKFNEAAFLQKTAGELAQVARVGSATPIGAKVMLLIAAAEKAKELLAAVKQHSGGPQTHLFDKKSHWLTEPMTAFGGFVTSVEFVEMGKRPKRVGADGKVQEPQPLGQGSVEGYTAIFSKFVRWMTDQSLTIDGVAKEHVLQFLDAEMEPQKKGRAKDLNSEIRRRYVRLLERVYDHLQVRRNPARLAGYSLSSMPGGGGKDLPKEWLTFEQQAAFMHALPARASSLSDDSAKAWRRRRDRAMMALMIGAGLTVTEVIELYIENIGDEGPTGSVPVTIWPAPSSEFSRKHVTMLRPFAVPEVAR